MKKTTMAEYEAARDAAIDRIVDSTEVEKSHDFIDMFYPQKHITLARKLTQFTHLKGKDFLQKRISLYRAIFDDIFLKNGELVQPSPHKKWHVLLASTYSEVASEFFDKLVNRDPLLPPHLKSILSKVDQKHTIAVDHDKISQMLPEYRKALIAQHPYPAGIVYGEVKAISTSILNIAKQFGYNILDRSTSHSAEKSDQKIKELKYADASTGKSRYKLISIGLFAALDDLTNRPLSPQKNSPISYVHNLIKKGLKALASNHSFLRLMKESDRAVLLWDNITFSNTKFRYSIVAKARDGVFTFPRRDLWKEFQKNKDLQISSEKHPVFSTFLSTDDSSEKKESQDSWVDKEQKKEVSNLNHASI